MAKCPHILVIDHSPELSEFFQELFEEEGYRVSRRAHLDGDVGMVAAVNPDLLLIDYRWDTTDENWASLHRLRTHATTRHIPIVLCTTSVVEAMVFEPQLRNLNIRVILKPFEIEQLLADVAAALKTA